MRIALLFSLLTITAASHAGEPGSLMQCLLSNAESVRQYDVVGSIESYIDGKHASVQTAESRFRLIIDFENELYFGAMNTNAELASEHHGNSARPEITKPGDEVPHEDKRFFQVVFASRSANRTKHRVFPGSEKSVRADHWLDGLKITGIPDLRCVGLFGTLEDFRNCPHFCYENMGHLPTALDTQATVRSLSKDVRQVDATRDSEVGRVGRKWWFDNELLLPTKVTLVETGGPFVEQTISWQEIDGLYVPSEVWLRMYNYRLPAEKRVEPIEETLLKLEWRSLNHTVDDSVIDSIPCDSMDEILKWIKQSNAD